MSAGALFMRRTSSEPIRKRRWVTLGVESLLIIFSVLLALALDEVRQGIVDRKLVAQVRRTIHDELTRNRALVKGRLPYHEEMSTLTQNFLVQNTVEKENGPVLTRKPQRGELGLKRGLGTAGRLGRTGWELAINSGALEHMDIEMTVVISKVYSLQEEVEEQERETLKGLYQLFQAYSGGKNLIGELTVFSANLNDLVLRQRELLTGYDRTLAMMRE
jgi:hypothetical protein